MHDALRNGCLWVPLLITATASFVLAGGSHMLSLAPVLYTWDPATLRFTYADPEAKDQTGYTPDELYELTPADIGTATETQLHKVAALLVGGEFSSIESTILFQRKDEKTWRSAVVRRSLLAEPHERPQILVLVRELLPTEIAAPSCVLSAT